MARPTKYTAELAAEILDRLAAGESLRSIGKDEHMPSEAAVRGWVVKNYRGFSVPYQRAREFGYDTIAEEIIEIADNAMGDVVQTEDGPRFNAENVQRSKLKVHARQWYLAKMAPKKYGEKTTLEHEVGESLEALIQASFESSSKS